MSYEGYSQHICRKGHYYTCPVDYGGGQSDRCSCGESSAWVNHVDDTNCDNHGFIPIEQFLVREAERCTCSCGNTHVVQEPTYRIPNKKETKAARTYTYKGQIYKCESPEKKEL